MQKNIKKVAATCFVIAATVGVFSLTFKNNSLGSLRANALVAAGDKCVQDPKVDCKSSATGNIYIGYRAGKIGSASAD